MQRDEENVAERPAPVAMASKPPKQQKGQQGGQQQGQQPKQQKREKGEGGKREGSGKGGGEGADRQQQAQPEAQQQPAGNKGSGVTKEKHHHHNHPITTTLSLFEHLPKKFPMANLHSVEGDPSLHPATIRLGLLYRSGAVREDDDRVAALLATFCNVIQDYKTPTNNTLSRDLDKHIRTQMAHLVECRQHCMGMGNLHKLLRHAISRVPVDMNESDAKESLIERLHSFFEDRIFFARDSIGNYVTNAVQDDDVLLTFGSSPLLRRVLLKVAAVRRFRLIIVDSRPLKDGLLTLRALSPRINCVYTPLSGLPTVMKEATRVILPATALLSNGSMLASAGSAIVASVAKAQRVPVIVLCESYKFSEKVQLGSIVFNELGSTSEIATLEEAPPVLTEKTGNNAPPPAPQFVYVPQLEPGYRGALESTHSPAVAPHAPYQILNPRYDCTPIGNISVVATETGLIPPTSIPVLIRELRTDVDDP